MESTESTDNSVETTQQGPTQEYVELHEASDDDIAAFLEGANARESQPQVAQPQAEPEKKNRTTSRTAKGAKSRGHSWYYQGGIRGPSAAGSRIGTS